MRRICCWDNRGKYPQILEGDSMNPVATIALSVLLSGGAVAGLAATGALSGLAPKAAAAATHTDDGADDSQSASLKADIARLEAKLSQSQTGQLSNQVDGLKGDLSVATKRISELEAALAKAASSPVPAAAPTAPIEGASAALADGKIDAAELQSLIEKGAEAYAVRKENERQAQREERRKTELAQSRTDILNRSSEFLKERQVEWGLSDVQVSDLNKQFASRFDALAAYADTVRAKRASGTEVPRDELVAEVLRLREENTAAIKSGISEQQYEQLNRSLGMLDGGTLRAVDLDEAMSAIWGGGPGGGRGGFGGAGGMRGGGGNNGGGGGGGRGGRGGGNGNF